jgi:hypothetical protein
MDVGGGLMSTAWGLPCVVLISVMSWAMMVAMTLPNRCSDAGCYSRIWVASLIPKVAFLIQFERSDAERWRVAG